MAERDGLDSAWRELAFQRWLDGREKEIEIMAALIAAAFQAGWDAARKVPADART